MKILFLDATAAFSPYMMEDKPTGGICTSLNIIPRKLAGMGHEVLVFSPHLHEDTHSDGVQWLCFNEARPQIQPDVVIYNRNFISEGGLRHFASARSVLWLHDIPQFNYLKDSAIHMVDKIVALSDYQRRSYADFFDVDPGKFTIIPNGIDPDIFYPGVYENRDPNLFIHASAPVKGGLELLGVVYQYMKASNPKFRLVSYSSQSLHQLDNAKFAVQLEKLKSMGIEICEPIPQRQLAEVMRKAWLLLMPNSYPENCSNVMLQAQACRLPIVASGIGDLEDKITLDGIFCTKTKPHDLFWHYKEFVGITSYLTGEPYELMQRHSRRDVKTWDQIAQEWNGMLESLLVKTAEKYNGTKISNPAPVVRDAVAEPCAQGVDLGR